MSRGDGGAAFKVGDRVEYTGRGSVVNEHRIGKTGEVTEVDPDGFGVSVKWDDGNALPMVVQEKNLRAVTAAPAGGGLAEVLAVLDAKCACRAISGLRDPMCCDCPAQDAEAAAINYLRSHGAAIAELIAADKEYDAAREAYSAKAPSGIGELDSRTDEDYERLRAARARRLAALSNIEGASHG